jgi:hypothetical protein
MWVDLEMTPPTSAEPVFSTRLTIIDINECGLCVVELVAGSAVSGAIYL